jgi:tetratricopeptide (TPR) repeat protein
MNQAQLFYNKTITLLLLGSLVVTGTALPVSAYDQFLFGAPHNIKVWDDNSDPKRVTDMLLSPACQLANDVLVESYLSQVVVDKQKQLITLNRLEPALSASLSEQKQLRDYLSISELILLQRMHRQGDYHRYLSRYVTALYKKETRQKSSDIDLLLRRLKELHVQGNGLYLNLASIILEASAKDKRYKLDSTQRLTMERWLALSRGESLPPLPVLPEGTTGGDLSYQALLSYIASRPEQTDNDRLKTLVKDCLASYDREPVEDLFYSVPARLDCIKLDSTIAEEQTMRVLDGLRMREKFDRPNTPEIMAQPLREVLSQLNEMQLTPDGEPVPDKPVNDAPLSDEQKAGLRKVLDKITVLAYLYKVDQRQEDAGRLYRLLYGYITKYFKDDWSLLGGISYDLAENAMWNESYDESIFYFDKSIKARGNGHPHSLESQTTKGMLGRVFINKWDNDSARQYYFDLMYKLAGLESTSYGDDPESARAICDLLLKKWMTASPEMRRHIDELIQGLADASVNGKRYDIARVLDQCLLTIKQKAVPPDPSAVMSVYWQMAWSEQNALDFERAAFAYSALIRDYPDEPSSTQAMWYQARAQCYDLLGKFDQARDDYREAIVYLKDNYRSEKDPVAKDRIYWNIADIRYNLKSRYLIYKSHYDDGLYTCFFSKKKFPLKVYLASDRKNGFGGELRALMLKAIAEWTDFDGSPITVKFVDNSSDADIFVERVTTYNDIPLGSAGRSSALYVRDSESHDDTRQLQKIHIRCYCESYDGVEGQKVSSFARAHLYTLFIHEFGHAIGLPHSPNGLDVMYWKACAMKPSERDKETIKRIYSTLEKELAAKSAAKAGSASKSR